MNLDYLAGLVDGEGCFSITKHETNKGPNGFDLHPYCSISLKQKWVLERVEEFLGFGYVRIKKSFRKNQADSYEFLCRSQEESLLFCNKLVPFLILKKERAILLGNFLVLRMKREVNGKHEKPYSKRELEIYSELKELNKRGVEA